MTAHVIFDTWTTGIIVACPCIKKHIMKIKGKLPHNHRELGGGAAVDGAVDCRRPPTPVSKSVWVNNKMHFLGQWNTVIMIHNRCKTLNFPFMRNLGFGGPSDAGGNYCSSSKSMPNGSTGRVAVHQIFFPRSGFDCLRYSWIQLLFFFGGKRVGWCRVYLESSGLHVEYI